MGRNYLLFSAILTFCLINAIMHSNALTVEDYLVERETLLDQEDKRFLGGSLSLNANEQLVNQILMTEKLREYDDAFLTQNFTPANHFFQSKPVMLQSQVFKFIRQMPKGGVLHLHYDCITPIDFLIDDVTYRPNLYICDPKVDPVTFRFASTAPINLQGCQWELVAARRAREGSVEFDSWLRSKLSLYTPNPQETYKNVNDIWTAFENYFSVVNGLIFYAPVFSDYYYKGLQTYYDDNVQYLELRGGLSEVYFLNGTKLDKFQVAALLQQVFENFKEDNPTFTGVKIIYDTSRRNVDNATIAGHISLASQLRAKYPDLVVGFDIAGHEDLGSPLKSFLGPLLSGVAADPDLRFFFHAGETSWEGTFADEDLIDAILLNTTRIGHGFAITKHPAVMELARSRGVAIEISPISNQVLGYVSDLRNHPATGLFADNFPLVISSDDPANWDAVALSSDFYMAFMGLAGRNADLRTLKQLALNSITYSAMSESEKDEAMIEWQNRWDTFITMKINEDPETTTVTTPKLVESTVVTTPKNFAISSSNFLNFSFIFHYLLLILPIYLF